MRPPLISPADRVDAGRRAERRVAALLASRGFVVLGTNVRVGRDELDVVALDGATLVVVEVRSRAKGARGAHPLETLDRGKLARLRRGAMRYAIEHGAEQIRVDVAAVLGDAIELVENAVDFTST